ncbi:MAG: AI-2E family transporter [Clostridia bacterium]|nr:AI-2E family transporter [Clostridia bacterium]
MKFEWNKRDVTRTVFSAILIVFAVICVFFFLRFEAFGNFISKIVDVCKPLLYAVAIAYLLWPILLFFEKSVFHGLEKEKPRKKLVRTLSIITTYIIFILALTLLFSIVIPQITDSVKMLMDKMNIYISTAQTWIDDVIISNPKIHINVDFINEQLEKLNDWINQLITWIYDNFKTLFSSITSYATTFATEIWNIVLGVIFAVYFLLFKENLIAQIKKLFAAILPQSWFQKAVHYTHVTDSTFGGFINGKLLDSLIIGILCFILMSIFRMPYAPLISLIIGITNVIPFFGPIIGAIPSAFFIFIADPGMTIWFIVLIFALQQLDGNVIGPKILGDFIGLSPLWIVVSITVMGGLFGVFGMFVGVPTFAVIYTIIKEITEMNLEKKGMPSDTDSYYREPEFKEIVHTPQKEQRENPIAKRFSLAKQAIARKLKKPGDSDKK